MKDSAVVLFSGGQDSTTCLAWAQEEFERVYALGFYYGQRHEIELTQAKEIAKERQVSLEFLPATALQELGAAALTNKRIEVNTDAAGTGNAYAEAHGLPSTFVPGRNLFFLTLAAAYGAKLGVYDLVTGVCAADEAGYPDCRPGFISATEDALCQALDDDVRIHTPLIDSTKGETFLLARDLGVLNLVLEQTHTCYQGDRSIRHAWGYGCGSCGACQERAKGWSDYQDLLAGEVSNA